MCIESKKSYKPQAASYKALLKYCRRCWGFTFIEVMIALALAISTIGVATVISVDLYKEFSAAIAYRNVHQNARKSLAYMSRDLRAGIALTAFATSDISFTKLSSTATTNTIRYYLSSQNLMRSETQASVTTTTNLTDNVTSVTFERWTNPGTPSTTLADTYEIRAFLTVTNSVVTNSVFRISTDLLQTRVLMRNKT